jgi:hypothetical protein
MLAPVVFSRMGFPHKNRVSCSILLSHYLLTKLVCENMLRPKPVAAIASSNGGSTSFVSAETATGWHVIKIGLSKLF